MTGSRPEERRRAEVAGHEARLSRLAQSLYAVESSLDLGFVRALAGAGGRSGQLALGLERAVTQVWARYPLARDHVQRLTAAAAAGRRGEADRLLRNHAITLPDGSSIGVGPLLELLQSEIDGIGEAATRLAEGVRRSLSVLDSSTAALGALLDRARAVGAENDVEVRAAQRAVERATTAIAAEPSATDVTSELEVAITGARGRIESLERDRASLPEVLARAHAQLQEISRLVRAGAEAALEARRKIAHPAGLVDPLDPGALDGEGPALRPWLASIDRQAADGDWRSATDALGQWQRLAAPWLANARSVWLANQAPLARRNELRGLLEAYQAKAAASGRVEDPELIRFGRMARDALYLAPCDLARAEASVLAYVGSLNADAKVGQA